jgi:hypothetical protein
MKWVKMAQKYLTRKMTKNPAASDKEIREAIFGGESSISKYSGIDRVFQQIKTHFLELDTAQENYKQLEDVPKNMTEFLA